MINNNMNMTNLGFIPKRIIREEFVPMLHKCITMNPYMSIFKPFRSSSKLFIKSGAGNYGKRNGQAKKEFGEGDEGYTEEIAQPSISGGNEDGAKAVDEIIEDPGVGQSMQQMKRQQFSYSNQILQDEDPIEDFSD